MIMQAANDNELLAGLGSYIRPLLSEAGTAMEMDKAGFVGVCFAHPRDANSRVFFAEYVNPENRAGKYSGDYILPGSCAFVRAVESAAKDGRAGLYVVSSDDPAAVREPLAKEFPKADRPVAVSAYLLGGGAESPVLYFIANSGEIFEPFSGRFEVAKELLVETLRTALFLAAAAEPQLAWWSEQLMSKLQEYFPSYTEAQKRALAKMRHPYLQWQEGREEVPKIIGPNLPPGDRRFLEAIRGADEVKVTGLLSGSFQDHNVYSAKVKPGGGAKEFDAAIKAAPQGPADKEVRGYFSLLPYFRNIRDVMPSPPLIFPTGEKARGGEDLYTVVTPHLGGQSLYDFIKDNWGSDVERVRHLRGVFGQLRNFIENIRPTEGVSEPLPPYFRLYKSHLGEEQRNGGRFEKTNRQFSTWLPAGIERSAILGVPGGTLMNPLWVLRQAPAPADVAGQEAFWQTSQHPRRMVRYGHGDFHVGNVLYIPGEERVTVLDFDYVEEHPEHEDPATLEVSFVLAVAATRSAVKRSQPW